jgi:hypothetical protein
LVNSLNAELNLIYILLALLGAHHILHFSRIRVKLNFSRHIFYNYSNTKFHTNHSRVLVGKPEGKRPLGRPRRRREDNIKMDLQEFGGGRGD